MSDGARGHRRDLTPPSEPPGSDDARGNGRRAPGEEYPSPPGGFDEPCRARLVGAVLPAPLRDDEILVSGEQRIYKRRKHWFTLLREVRRSAALAFVAAIAATTPPIGPVLGLLLLAAVVVLVRWARRRSARTLAGVAAAVVLGAVITDMTVVGWVVAVLAVARVAVAFVEYRCYSFLYLTNRRLVATSGIIQRDVSTMPVARITDTKLRLPWFGSWLDDNGPDWIQGYGEFSVESAGQNQALGQLYYLLDAEFFAEMAVLLATKTSSISDDGT